MSLSYALKRVYLINIFKFKDFISNFYSIKKLDYKKNIFIYISNLREYFTRANSCSKEPETINWIEKNVKKSKVLFDIGANIGAYSLVAAKNGIEVYSFEPGYTNFNSLNRNITLNNLDSKISSFQIAFSSKTKLDYFNYLETDSGTSKCYYNEENEFHIKQKIKVRKGVLIFTLDNFIKAFKVPFPEMLKIDVDGAEYDIINGSFETLRNKKLKTILIEIDLSDKRDKQIIKIIEGCGFKLIEKHNRSREVYNFIFERK